jgi:Secretion system C-terminal sorting domain/PKD domain
MKVLFLLLSLCLANITSNATTWYISPSGNDATGNGTMANPWKTLFKATSAVAAAGDIIHVNAGTYTETQKCFLKPGVHIEGEGNTSVIKSTVSSIWTEIINVVSVEGTNGNQHISNLKMDGNNLTTHRAIWVGGRSNVSIYNCTIVDFYETGVIFSGRDNGNPLPPNAFYATGNSFHDNIMNNCALYNGNGSGCLMIGGQVGMLVYNNTITQTQRPATLNGWPIKYYNEGHTKGLKIYNNILTKIPLQPGDAWTFCLELFNAEGTEIYGNEIQGSIDLNYSDPGATGWTYWIHDNIIKQPTLSNRTEEGIIFEYSFDGVRVENNVFENINQCITSYPRSGTVLKNFVVRNNLCKNIGQLNNSDGYFIGGFGGALGNFTLDNWQVYNNTFVATTTANARPNFAVSIGYGGTFGVNNFLCKNNIFQGVVINPMLTNNRAVFTNCQFQYNDFYGNGDNINLIPSWASTGLNFPASTIVSNNISANPQYVSPTDFTLQSTSPLINAGINVGLPYNGAAPDIGYAEYTGVTNAPPTANAGPDQTIAVPANSVNLTGSGADTDGTITTYLWTKILGPAGPTITNPGSAITTVTGFNTPGTYQFELRVTDNNGAVGKDTMQVILTNVAPTANAGPDETIALPTSLVNLAGSGADTDGIITTYLWTKILGPAGPTITNPASALTTVTGFATVGTYQFELKVTDNHGAIGKDTMQVIVNPDPNIAPTANAGADQTISAPVNSVTVTGSGNDPDGTVTGYLWTKVTGPAGGTITNPSSPSTGITGLVLSGVYKFELRVTDNNGAIGRDTMQVTLTNVAPTANAGADKTIALPTSSVNVTGSGADTDGIIATYLWTKISGPAGSVITNPAAASTTITAFTTVGIYQFELRVTDNSGAIGRDTMQVTVNPDPNIAPTANAGANQTITLPTSTVSLTGSGNDPDGTIAAYLWTKITGPAGAAITNPSSASTTITGFITAGIYQFVLRVTDNNGAVGRDTMQVIVNPDPNIAPTANAGANQNITLPTNTINLTGTGNDVDGTITSYIWTKIAGPGGGGGTLTNPNAASTSVTGLIAGIYKFELRVTDNSGAVGRDTMQVTVFAPNMAPTANAGLNQSMTLPTNTTTLNGSGNDVDGTITAYRWTRIVGPSTYTITNSTSAVTTITGLIAGVYLFELQVTDNSGAIGKDTVQITVNAENIPPVANAGSDQFVTLPTNTVTLSGSGTDADGSIVAYAWKQLSGPVDKLTSLNTAVTVLNNLVEGIYTFELTVTDNRGAIDKDSVMVTLSPAAFAAQNTFKVYPNPVIDITTLQINTSNVVTTMLVMVTDIQGKMVYQKQVLAGSGNIKEIIDMSRFAGGSYFVTVYFDGQQKQTVKIIKR